MSFVTPTNNHPIQSQLTDYKQLPSQKTSTLKKIPLSQPNQQETNGKQLIERSIKEKTTVINVNNKKYSDGMTALMLDARNGNLDAIKALIATGADVDIKDDFGMTALMHAALNGQLDTVKLLIAEGADTNIKDSQRMIVLHHAVCDHNNGHHIVKELLKSDVYQDKSNITGISVLLYAAGHGTSKTVKILLDAGFNINMTSFRASSAINNASRKRNFETVKLLVNAGFISYLGKSTPLIDAVRHGDLETVKKLIATGIYINLTDNLGMTALHHAASVGNDIVVRELLGEGIKNDGADKNGRTPLMHAVHSGDSSTVKALLDAGVNKNKQDNTGMTALIIAVLFGGTTVPQLLDAGVNIDLIDHSKMSALDYAKHFYLSYSSVVTSLVNHRTKK
jgi:ankyrin repeat protein